MSRPQDLLEQLRNDNLASEKLKLQITYRVCSIASIAFGAVYRAAAAGNVQCRVAVQEIEKIIKQPL